MHKDNKCHDRFPSPERSCFARYAISICLVMFMLQGPAAAERMEISAPVSRIGDADGGLTVSLQAISDGSGALEMTAWASPRLLGDHAQTNSIALLTDDHGAVIQQAAFSCRRRVQTLAKIQNNTCQERYTVSRDALNRATYLFIFNTFCVWRQTGGKTIRVTGCVTEGDTVEQTTTFLAQTLPGLVREGSVAPGDRITAGDWRGIRLR
ncbi:hypothetical protein P7L74_13100 [Tistrella mobilis]|uniref:hypothetical protein n=1 Tax=Tistrella mobilis TaxID=171437 RepID=UPI003555FA4A